MNNKHYIDFIPNTWYATTGGKIPTHLWVACGVVLSDAELPIYRMRYVRPVAAESDGRLFEAVEEWYTAYWARELYIKGFPIFTMTHCRNFSKSSSALMNVFLEEFKVFSTKPLSRRSRRPASINRDIRLC